MVLLLAGGNRVGYFLERPRGSNRKRSSCVFPDRNKQKNVFEKVDSLKKAFIFVLRPNEHAAREKKYLVVVALFLF